MIAEIGHFAIVIALVVALTLTGVLEPGKLADLVVLDRDPFLGDAREIGAASVVSTWVDGECVFES